MSAGLPATSQSNHADWSLRWRTPPVWATLMLPHLQELLVEQAHLEKKAAAAAVSFLFRLPTEAAHRELSALAREELLHFERTLRLLQGRGIPFRPQPPCAYAGRLKRVVAADLPGRLLDELLVCAVIEARSHERMALLGAAVAGTDPELAVFYRDLCAAEARHGPAYVSAATASFGREPVAARWAVVVEHEAAVLAALPWSPRLHSGMASAEAAS